MRERWLTFGLALSACLPGATDETCPAWTEARGDECAQRAWQPLGAPLGQPGAREVQLAVGGDDVLLAWSHATASEGHVVIAEAEGDGSWSITERPDPGARGVEPAVAIGPQGRALLAWKHERDDGEIHLARRDAEGSWHWPDAALSWPGAAYEPRVAFAPDGEALVVWNQWTGAHFGVAVARRPADAPDDPFVGPTAPEELLSPPVNYSNAPRLAIGSGGEAVVTWYQAPVDDLMVFVSERRGHDGSFARPIAEAFLSPPGGPVDSHPEANPQPALHESGAAAVAWTQQLDDDHAPVFLAVRDLDGTWHGPASLDDPLSDPRGVARCPTPAFAPDGTLVITWYETIDDETSVVVWREPDGSPTSLSTPGAEAVHPTLGIEPAGGTVVAWAERERDAWQVVARRHDPETDQWQPTEALGEPVLGLAPTPVLAVDPDGRLWVAWAEGSVVEGRVRVATFR